tara:strand:+ start:1174 stop:1593 length:420 start_codon:yes stop_codon:yes gene_type:complete
MTSGCVVEIEAPLEMFVRKIDEQERFKIVGTDKEDTVLVLQDSTIEKGTLGHRVDIDIEEIENHLNDVLDVLLNGRNDTVCHGITRIVGYYSRITNWNASKVGEQRDRIRGREHGAYGFNGTGVDTQAYSDALATMDNM